MKIELDLTEIFEDEDGERISVSMAERIEAAIIAKAEKTVVSLIKETFDKQISEQITGIVKEQLNSIVVDLLDKEFTPISKWGERDEPITLRNRICKDVENAMKWKDSNYSSERSIYTDTVKTVVAEHLKSFGKEFNRVVDEKLVSECMQYAVNKLRGAVEK